VSEEGYEIQTAGNGQEALDILGAFSPDLVILDLMMPVMDGMAFLDTIRADPRYRHLPVIIVTAKVLSPEEVRRLSADAPSLVKQMIDIYLDYAPKMLHNALAGEQAGDCLAIEKAVHSLKSSSGHIGASAVHDLARRLESLARNKQLDSLKPLLPELETAFEQ